MAETKKYAQWIDIPDGNGGAERKWLKDAEARDAILHPVDVNTLTPSSTFVKNAIIGINGVIYQAKQATSHFPVVLLTSGNAFVVNVTTTGRKAFVVSDATVHADWEQWTDAAIEYWLEQLAASINQKASVSDVLAAQVPDTGFTVQQLLQGMAAIMPHTIVVTGG